MRWGRRRLCGWSEMGRVRKDEMGKWVGGRREMEGGWVSGRSEEG